MTDQATQASDFVCESCKGPTYNKVANVTLWSGDQLVLVENVPVQICETCQEQYYDEDISNAVLQLASAGFPQELKVREITVPVFRLPPGVVSPQSED